MPPGIAAILFCVLIAILFWLDRDQDIRTSWALWLPVVWLSLSGSRSVSQWLQAGDSLSIEAAEQSMLEGNPVDRLAYTILLVLGLAVLLKRRQSVMGILRANTAICGFFVYCAVSVLWSDYPDVSFKRWSKAVGDFVMVLIVLSEGDRAGAVKKLLSRPAFVLIPISVLFVKYYPAIGRGYSRWEGTAFYVGATTTKNILGMICLLFGLGALWRLLAAFRMRPRSDSRRRRQFVAHGTILAMAVWLCWVADSMTSLWCLILGAAVLLVSSSSMLAKKRGVVHLFVGAVILLPFAILFLGVGSDVAHGATGRNISTLTDRTGVWKAALSVAGNPFIGTGFEGFWLGPRLEPIWNLYWWHPTEAHNGYLEVFLNLGWVGVVMLAIVIARGYRTIVRAVYRSAPEGHFMLALFTVGIIYNFTEAAFFRMMTPTWILFLLAITNAPRRDMTRSEVSSGHLQDCSWASAPSESAGWNWTRAC
jgi:exopolysaccharide production protein ExoQ